VISVAGRHFDLVVMAWSVIPSAAIAAVLLSARDALSRIGGEYHRADEASR
jgi:hypothetical protein